MLRVGHGYVSMEVGEVISGPVYVPSVVFDRRVRRLPKLIGGWIVYS